MAITANMVVDGKRTVKGIEVPLSTQIKGWHVEANETTADVYVDLEYSSPLIVSGLFPYDLGKDSQIGIKEDTSASTPTFYEYWAKGGTKATRLIQSDGGQEYLAAAADGFSPGVNETKRWLDEETGEWKSGGVRGEGGFIYTYTYDDKTVWYSAKGNFWGYTLPQTYANLVNISSPVLTEIGEAERDAHGLDGIIAWSMIYAPNSSDGEKLLARFAIEMQNAVDPTQPDQWDQQPDTGDPQYRLDLTVWGALSGRHNDPLRDPSYSYVPADQDSVKGYGGGGDGGHGGGGGGGASTVIVYDFGTDKAGSKEINAYARRHGYGSSGGRGGRGGDGCIIVYY